MPVSPMSARQIAFQVARAAAGRPSIAAHTFATTAETIDSIMKPVFGAPVGTGVASTGGIATHTPAANTLANFGLRWCASMRTKPRGLPSSGAARTASTPVNGGITIA